MIMLTRLSGSAFVLNSDLIERVDSTPDTVITLVDGTKYVVAESMGEVVAAVRTYRGDDHRRAATCWVEPTAPAGAPRPPAWPRRARRTPAPQRRGGVLMDPATLIGVVVGLVIIVVANMLEGGNPASLLLLPADAAGVRRHAHGDHRRRHAQRRQGRRRRPSSTPSPARSQPAGDVVPTVVALAEKARREGLLALEDALKDHRRPVPGQGRHHGHRRHRPRGGARHPRGRAVRQAVARQALREVLRRRRRLRAHHRHHRHRHGPGARAGEPGPARGARPPDRRRRSSRPCGASCRPT